MGPASEFPQSGSELNLCSPNRTVFLMNKNQLKVKFQRIQNTKCRKILALKNVFSVWEFFGYSLGILWEFFGISLGIILEFFEDVWLGGCECMCVDFG